MKLHSDARTCPKSRRLLCERVRLQGWTVAEAANAAGISERTAFKWLARYDREGEAGLVDRSSRPHSTPVALPKERISAIAGLRRLRMTGAQIAGALSMPTSTVARVLRRLGLGRLKDLGPDEPPNRYERRHPGELVHIDVKKLGRFRAPGHRVHGDRSRRNHRAGWEFVHVCVDDATRVAYVEVLDDEKATTAVGFLGRAVAFYRSLGVEVARVMRDNGSAYRSTIHAMACRLLGLRHLRTRAYRPRTNAERFIRTMLNECLYAAIYQSSEQRRTALRAWMQRYNERRPHGGLGGQVPMTRLRQSLNNVLVTHTSASVAERQPRPGFRPSDPGSAGLGARSSQGGAWFIEAAPVGDACVANRLRGGGRGIGSPGGLRGPSYPIVVLSSLPWMLAIAWVARRLLGLGAGTFSRTLAAGFAGWLAGGAVTLLAIRRTATTPTFVLVATVSEVLFTMLAVVAFELVARRRTAVPSGAVPHPVRNVRGRIARAHRYLHLGHIAARHGLRIRRGDDPLRLPARQVRLAMEEAGGMFVKLGQMLAGRPEVVGASMATELGHLQEDVAPAPIDAVERLLEDELGAPAADVFLTFDREPIAAASIAQAHSATLRDGTRVIVKVQRPGVQDVVQRDLSILLRVSRRAEERTAWGRSIGVGGIAHEFAENVVRELDFGQEATNIEEVTKALAGTPEVRVPSVHRELSTTRVLVLEELEGVSIAQHERLSELDIDREKLADVLLRTSLESVMNGERFHADPHPGNVMVLSDGRLGLLDLGSTGRLDAFEQASIAGMLTAIHDNDPELLREAVLEIATSRRPIEERLLDHALARFMARHLGRGAVPNLAMLSDLAQTFFQLGIVLPSSTTLLFRMLVTLEVTLTTLCPGYPVIRAAQDFAPELVRERLGEGSIGDRVRDEAVAVLPVLRRVPRHLDRLATIAERGELRARVSLFSTEADAAVVGRWVNRLIVGLVGASVGIVSVMLLALSGGPVVSGSVSLFDVFGYVGLVLATILLLRVVVAAIKEESGGDRS